MSNMSEINIYSCNTQSVFLPGLKEGKVLIWEKGTFVHGISF